MPRLTAPPTPAIAGGERGGLCPPRGRGRAARWCYTEAGAGGAPFFEAWGDNPPKPPHTVGLRPASAAARVRRPPTPADSGRGGGGRLSWGNVPPPTQAGALPLAPPARDSGHPRSLQRRFAPLGLLGGSGPRGDLCFIRSPPTAVAPALSPFACRFSLIAQSFPWCRRRPLTRAPGGLPPTRTCRKPACAYGSARHAQSACLATQWQGKCPLTPLARASRHVAHTLQTPPAAPPPVPPPCEPPSLLLASMRGGGSVAALVAGIPAWRLLWGEFGLP